MSCATTRRSSPITSVHVASSISSSRPGRRLWTHAKTGSGSGNLKIPFVRSTATTSNALPSTVAPLSRLKLSDQWGILNVVANDATTGFVPCLPDLGLVPGTIRHCEDRPTASEDTGQLLESSVQKRYVIQHEGSDGHIDGIRNQRQCLNVCSRQTGVAVWCGFPRPGKHSGR